MPPIKGLKEQLKNSKRSVFTIFDFLNNLKDFQKFDGRRIAIIGGGAVGLDVVEYFATRNAQDISIVEMQSEVGKDLDMITHHSMMNVIKRYAVKVYTDSILTEIFEDHFEIKQANQELNIPFDLGFLCLGMRAYSPLMDKLLEYGKTMNAAVVNIGDSKLARRIIDGSREARDILTTIQHVDQTKGKITAYRSVV